MKKVTLLPLILIMLTVLALTSVAANGLTFTTSLAGAAERPSPGDPDGSGTATITLFPSTSEICWEIQVSGITLPATAAHIHEAPAGVPGPVVVPLSAPDASGFSSGCTSVERSQIVDILQDPEEYYVNVHNVDYPAGAVRGQLSR
jgi:hypothetical protein